MDELEPTWFGSNRIFFLGPIINGRNKLGNSGYFIPKKSGVISPYFT